MKLTYEAINLLMLLIPGLISSSIYNLIRRKATESTSTFSRITESLVFSFLVYVSVSFICTWEPLAQAEVVEGKIVYKLTNDLPLILYTLTASVLIPSILGAIAHHDLHMKTFRMLKLTDRTSRDTAWDDVFSDEKRFITVHLNDERRISGWPLYYSNNNEEGFIYLSQASWVNENNEYIDTESHGILINKENIELIEFMNNPDKEGANNE